MDVVKRSVSEEGKVFEYILQIVRYIHKTNTFKEGKEKGVRGGRCALNKVEPELTGVTCSEIQLLKLPFAPPLLQYS